MSTFPEILFDESLPTLVKAIAEQLGRNMLEQGLIVRDSSGRLCFLSSEPSPSDGLRVNIEKRIADVLGAYARADSVIAFRDEPGVQRLLEDSAAFPM